MTTPEGTTHGTPCRKCGGTLRYTRKGQRCVACQRNAARALLHEKARATQDAKLAATEAEYARFEGLRVASVFAWRGAVSLGRR